MPDLTPATRLDEIILSGGAPAFPRATVRRPAGYVRSDGPPEVQEEGDTLQCVHCQMHWVVKPGSGTQRGFCFKCSGPTCGKQGCMDKCVPWEKMIEEMER